MKKLVVLIFLFSTFQLFSQTPVTPGDGTLSAAIAAAKDGDVLQLTAGATYTENTNSSFGTLTNKNITIEVPGINSAKAVLQLASGSEFFTLGDSSGITLMNLELDGNNAGSSTTNHLISFSVDTPKTEVFGIKLLGCYVHDVGDNVINAGSSSMVGTLVIDSTWINDCVMQNTGTIVYLKYAGADFISVTNSTFDVVSSYGMRIGGPGYTKLPDHVPAVDVDHTTWYDIGTTDGREVLLLEKGPNTSQWVVSNSIFVKQVNKSKTFINLKEMSDTTLATVTNICMWDVGAIDWRSHTVMDTTTMDPGFKDAANGDFTLPQNSKLLTFGINGGIIGDPRWNPTVLPVELTSFTAVVAKQNVNLNWSTATELDNSGFAVERSIDNQTWSKIAFIKGAGTSTRITHYSYTDNPQQAGKIYYRLKQTNFDGSFKYSNTVEVSMTAPAEFTLNQNYPNPFNPSTKISYSIPKASHVKLIIYNMLGKEVVKLVDNKEEAGNHSITFDASNLASGIYLYKLQTNTNQLTKKMILLK